MKTNDVLMKKWCFGIGRARPRTEAVENARGEMETVRTYPKYRTIVLKVTSAKKVGKQWKVEGVQYSSLTGKPKKVKMVLDEKTSKKLSYYTRKGQKRPWLKVAMNSVTEEGIPPVGSLISVNKKHGIVTEVDRNQLTVWVNNKYETITVKPGSIKWNSDKILVGAMGGTN